MIRIPSQIHAPKRIENIVANILSGATGTGSRVSIVLLLIYALGATAKVAEHSNLAVFHGNGGFEVRYPSDWVRINDSRDELSILSSKDRVKGVVIPRGEAEIISREIRDPIKETFREFVEDRYHIDVLADITLENDVIRSSHCDSIEKIEGKFEITPTVIEEEKLFFCRINGRVFLTLYTYWASDGPNLARERIAFDVARSVKISTK